MEVSLFHNILITGASDQSVYVWDYEFVKLIGCVTLEKHAEPTAIHVIPGYPLLFLATNTGFVYVLKF